MSDVVSDTDYVGIALLITALGTFVTAVAGAVVITRRVGAVDVKVGEVRAEVKTFNETTAGGLAAADETRRVEAIDHDERTAKEQRHLDDAPPEEPPQGPAA